MKKVFIVSLLLVSIFLISNAEVASAQCMDYHSYECTIAQTQYGEITNTFNTCVGLCYDDGFEVVAYGWFTAYLYPATDNRHLLGTANSANGWAGCSVEFKGRSLIGKLSYIQDDGGYVDIFKCTPTSVGCY